MHLEQVRKILSISFFRYVERLTDSLQQKLKLSKNMQEQVTRLREKADAALAIQSQTEPKYAALAKKTKILQNQVYCPYIYYVKYSR